MLTRQIGKILRGKSTPLHLMFAAVLGSMLGFMPDFWSAPGLIVALTALLVVLNANLAAAAIIGLLAKLVSFPLISVSFAAGQFLLDGPTQALFRWLVNAPVLAWFGMERYLTTGAAAIGLAFGLICGAALCKIVTGFRRKMASLDENSEAFRKYASSGWVKAMMFIFVGGRKGKFTYAQLAERKFGNPIRIPGAIAVVLFIALAFILQSFLSGPILTAYLKDGLERANGATVDLGNAEVDLRAGRMTIDSLAMADPNALETDLLRALKVEAAINTTNLLRKRTWIDRLELSEAVSGVKRAFPGRRIGPATEPLPPEPGEDKTLDDYINDAKRWKERLAQAREWLEKISGTGEGSEKPETLKERIARQIRESGYASVVASHLIDQSPTLVIAEIVSNGVKAEQIPGEVFDVRGEFLSSHPHLLDQKPKLSITSRSDRIAFVANLNEQTSSGDGKNLHFKYNGLPVERVSEKLAIANQPSPISGGTMDIALNGNWSAAGIGHIDLPLLVTLRDTTITLPKAGSSPVKELPLALGLRGPIDNPRVHIDDKQMGDALAKAGAGALAAHVRGEADKKIDEAKNRATEKVTETIDKAVGDKVKDAIGNLLPGSKKK